MKIISSSSFLPAFHLKLHFPVFNISYNQSANMLKKCFNTCFYFNIHHEAEMFPFFVQFLLKAIC